VSDITVIVSTPGSSNTWGSGNWNLNAWAQTTGVSLSTGEPTIDAEIGVGWGGRSWGLGAYGEVSSSGALLTGLELTSTVAPLEFAGATTGWGRQEWGAKGWGIAGDVFVNSFELTSSLGTPTIENEINVGWGRKTWGNLSWGEAFSVEASSQLITTAVGDVTPRADFEISVSGQSLTTTLSPTFAIQIDGNIFVNAAEDQIDSAVGTVPSVTGTALVEPTGQSLSGSIGQVVPEPKIPVDVTGISASLSLGTISLEQSTVEPATGINATLSVGQVDAVSVAEASGIQITGSVGNTTILGDANIDVSGIALSTSIAGTDIISWNEVDLGVSNTWTEVDLAA